MAKYGARINLTPIAAAYKTAGALRAPAASMRRLKVYDFSFGASGTPADNAMEADIVRTTANGTDTAFTPNPLDPADAACVATFGQNASAEPTVTANSQVFDLGFNQRASYRWVCKDGSELIVPATANAGLALRILSPAYTGALVGSMLFEE